MKIISELTNLEAEHRLTELFVPMTNGGYAIVDPSDFDAVMAYNWVRNKDNYAYARVNGNKFKTAMHRFIIDAKKGEMVDHVNGKGLDNRRVNLRLCNKSQNATNTSYSRGKSKYRGVQWSNTHNKWIVQIRANGKRKYIGIYEDEIIAAEDYQEATKKYHGRFRPNETSK